MMEQQQQQQQHKKENIGGREREKSIKLIYMY
jgi:hypothetical protein